MTQEAEVQVNVSNADVQAVIQQDPKFGVLIQNAALIRTVQELSQATKELSERLEASEAKQEKSPKKGG